MRLDSEIQHKDTQLRAAQKLVHEVMAKADHQLKAFAIPFSDIDMGEQIGEGSFGAVSKGVLRGTTTVAIKQMRVSKVSVKAVEKFKGELIESHAYE